MSKSKAQKNTECWHEEVLAYDKLPKNQMHIMFMQSLFQQQQKAFRFIFHCIYFNVFADINDLLFGGTITWESILFFYSLSENESYSS